MLVYTHIFPLSVRLEGLEAIIAVAASTNTKSHIWLMILFTCERVLGSLKRWQIRKLEQGIYKYARWMWNTFYCLKIDTNTRTDWERLRHVKGSQEPHERAYNLTKLTTGKVYNLNNKKAYKAYNLSNEINKVELDYIPNYKFP